jgi:hypothetical protein
MPAGAGRMTDTMTIMPGGGISRRPLHVILAAVVGGDSRAIASQLVQPATAGEPQPGEDTIV